VPFLSTDKVLVILVVALVVLGPNKLPQVARQIGSLWSEFQRFRQRLESEVRSTFPDLPSTETLTRAVRSPLSVLEDLGATSEGSTTALDQAQGAEAPAGMTANGDGPGAELGAERGATGARRPWWERPVDGGGATPAPAVTAPAAPGVRHTIRATQPLFLDDPSMN